MSIHASVCMCCCTVLVRITSTFVQGDTLISTPLGCNLWNKNSVHVLNSKLSVVCRWSSPLCACVPCRYLSSLWSRTVQAKSNGHERLAHATISTTTSFAQVSATGCTCFDCQRPGKVRTILCGVSPATARSVDIAATRRYR